MNGCCRVPDGDFFVEISVNEGFCFSNMDGCCGKIVFFVVFPKPGDQLEEKSKTLGVGKNVIFVKESLKMPQKILPKGVGENTVFDGEEGENIAFGRFLGENDPKIIPRIVGIGMIFMKLNAVNKEPFVGMNGVSLEKTGTFRYEMKNAVFAISRSPMSQFGVVFEPHATDKKRVVRVKGYRKIDTHEKTSLNSDIFPYNYEIWQFTISGKRGMI